MRNLTPSNSGLRERRFCSTVHFFPFGHLRAYDSLYRGWPASSRQWVMLFELRWRIIFRQISAWGGARRRNYMATAAGRRRLEELDPRAKNAIRGTFLGGFVDMFDIYLPIVVLAPAIAYFVSPELGSNATAVVSGSIHPARCARRPGRSLQHEPHHYAGHRQRRARWSLRGGWRDQPEDWTPALPDNCGPHHGDRGRLHVLRPEPFLSEKGSAPV
jgi:hypothetical protein